MKLLHKYCAHHGKLAGIGQAVALSLLASCLIPTALGQSAPQQIERTAILPIAEPGQENTGGDPHLKYLIYATGTALLLIVALALWNRALRRVAGRRTAALQASESRLRDEMQNVTSLLGVTSDVTERKKAEALTAGQKHVLEMIASGATLSATLDALLRVVEAQSPDMLGSILLLEPDGIHLRHGASPSLPEEFTRSIDGYAIGPSAGSCGTAVFRREPVMAADIAQDPLWADYRQLALPYGLRACWSSPIFGRHEEILGSFAIYSRQPGLPPEAHLKLIAAATDTAAICINNHRTEQALRDSEARFREVVENIEEAVWVKAADTNQLLYISPGYDKIWGRSCASLYAAPDSWPDAIHADDRERVRQAVLKRGLRGYDEEYRIVRPDGALRWIHNRAFPIRNSLGEVYRFAGVAEDITERRELEEQYRQAQKLEAVGALASGIAHDFNNILSAIQGNTELALEDIEPEHPAGASLREILKASGRAKNLVQQILTFTQTQQPELRVIALGSVVEETRDFLRVMLPSSVDLRVRLAADAPNVLANATQIQQALWNLCTNAWHALAGQRGRIDVELRRVEIDAAAARADGGPADGLYACLSVSDTGKGMDASTLNRIFKPFFTTKPAGNGTGLGLSITQAIVKSHAGAIVVDSVLGKGSTFQLYFPAVARPADAVSAPTATATSRRGAGQHILYVDDEEALVLLTTRIFERLGYRVSGYTEPQSALDAFRADPDQYDVALTDFNMAGTSGLEVAGKLMTIRPDLPVILTSGYVTDDLREQARRTGIREVIYKPNSVQEFCDAVHRAVHEPAKR